MPKHVPAPAPPADEIPDFTNEQLIEIFNNEVDAHRETFRLLHVEKKAVKELTERLAIALAPPPLAEHDPEPSDPLKLSDEDAAKLREMMGQQNMRRLPDGGCMVTVKVDADMLPILLEWADGAGEPFESYVQRQVETSLTATVLGSQVG